MKNKILSIVSVIAFLMGMSACHSPEDFNPTVERNIINNLTHPSRMTTVMTIVSLVR